MSENAVGLRIRELRKSKNLTQKAFGNLINTSYGHISNIEAGKDMPSERLLNLICMKFGVNKEWLKYGNGKMFSISTPIYSKVSRLTEAERNSIEKILGTSDINDKHLYLFKVIVEILNKKQIQENSDDYYFENIKMLLIKIDKYLNIAADTATDLSNAINPFKEDMESAIISSLNSAVDSFYSEDLNNDIADENV